MRHSTKQYSSPALGLIAALLVWILSSPAQGHNNRLAFVPPLGDIAVDGNLSDWPIEMVRYAIDPRAPFPTAWQRSGADSAAADTAAAKAWFGIGYKAAEGALYIAVEVMDESAVIDSAAGRAWNSRDGCEIFFDRAHRGSGAPLRYVVRGTDPVELYVRDIRGEVPAGVEAGVQRRDGIHQYEWRFDARALDEAGLALGAGAVLGFDIAIADKDQDGRFTWVSWGPGPNQSLSSQVLGDAALVEADIPVQKLLGLLSLPADRWGGSPLAGLDVDRQVGDALRMTGQFLGRAAREVDINQVIETLAQNGISVRLDSGPPAQVPVQQEVVSSGYKMFFTGVLLAFTLLHLLLFLFDPNSRENLYFATYTGSIGVSIFFSFQLGLAPDTGLDFGMLADIAKLFMVLSGLGLLYSLFYPKVPRHFWIFLAVAVFCTGWGLFSDFGVFFFVGIFYWIAVIETVRVIWGAIRQKQDGAWIIGFGLMAFVLNISRLTDLGEFEYDLLYFALVPLVAMSVILARNVARTNRDLESQLVQISDLSTKTQEQNRALEEAYQQIQGQNVQVQEANRLKSDFLARMSHDLRTPMNAIIGYTRILLRRAREALDERQYRNLQNIQISANNLLTLINDILDLSKIEADRMDLKIEEVDPGHLVRECVSAVTPLVGPEVELRRELADVGTIRTDQNRLRRVLMNLLSNAVKFTEAGHIAVFLRRSGAWLELGVADTGVGIPPEDLAHIFNEFRQVESRGGKSQEGTGLGLAIAQKSIELLGGTVAVESEVGVGTRFTVRVRDYREV